MGNITDTQTTAGWIPSDTFGARLAQVRQRMHWNISEAAAACGLNAESWRGWEKKDRLPRDPSDRLTPGRAEARRPGWGVIPRAAGCDGVSDLHVGRSVDGHAKMSPMAHVADLMAEHGFVVRAETERIEATMGGLFGGPPDPCRRFIPGVTTYTIEAADGRRWVVQEEPDGTVEWFADYMRRYPADY